MQIFFDQSNAINGSKTQNYLLEKIRVVQQGKSERNFHIFYQLVKACSASERTKFKLKSSPAEYVCTCFFLLTHGASTLAHTHTTITP